MHHLATKVPSSPTWPLACRLVGHMASLALPTSGQSGSACLAPALSLRTGSAFPAARNGTREVQKAPSLRSGRTGSRKGSEGCNQGRSAFDCSSTGSSEAPTPSSKRRYSAPPSPACMRMRFDCSAALDVYRHRPAVLWRY